MSAYNNTDDIINDITQIKYNLNFIINNNIKNKNYDDLMAVKANIKKIILKLDNTKNMLTTEEEVAIKYKANNIDPKLSTIYYEDKIDNMPQSSYTYNRDPRVTKRKQVEEEVIEQLAKLEPIKAKTEHIIEVKRQKITNTEKIMVSTSYILAKYIKDRIYPCHNKFDCENNRCKNVHFAKRDVCPEIIKNGFCPHVSCNYIHLKYCNVRGCTKCSFLHPHEL